MQPGKRRLLDEIFVEKSASSVSTKSKHTEGNKDLTDAKRSMTVDYSSQGSDQRLESWKEVLALSLDQAVDKLVVEPVKTMCNGSLADEPVRAEAQRFLEHWPSISVQFKEAKNLLEFMTKNLDQINSLQILVQAFTELASIEESDHNEKTRQLQLMRLAMIIGELGLTSPVQVLQAKIDSFLADLDMQTVKLADWEARIDSIASQLKTLENQTESLVEETKNILASACGDWDELREGLQQKLK